MKWKNLAADTTTFFITATVTEWQPLFLHEEPRHLLLADFIIILSRHLTIRFC